MAKMSRRVVLQGMLGASVGLVACAGKRGPATPATDESAVAGSRARLEAVLDDFRLRQQLFQSAEVSIARGNTVIAQGRVGDVPPGTRYDVGSVSKPVVALLVLQACAAGLMSLDTEVGEYLHWYPERQVTVAALLTHSTGIPHTATQAWPIDAAGLEDYRRRVAAAQQRNGVPFQAAVYYSSGYFLLAQALESAHGRPLSVIAREGVFAPLGMRATTFDKAGVPDAQVVLPFDKAVGARQESVRRMPPIGETGMLSTAEDLLRFIAAFRGGITPLSQDLRALCTTEYRGLNRSLAFWMKGARNVHGCFAASQSPLTIGHPGYSGCMVSHDPASGISIAYTTDGMALSADSTNHGRLQEELLRIVDV